MARPIALLTDFGLKDHYVGSLKGVILSINPRAVILDVTHDIRPQNIREGAFVLQAVYSVLPKGTIVVVVVDPGVGSARQAICVKTRRGFLLAPNNGILSMVLAEEKGFEVRAIVNDRYFRKPVSSTFHGRDIFSPSAAWLSKKNIFRSFGPILPPSKLHQFSIPMAIRNSNSLRGEIIYIDHFGNAMTNISKDKLKHSAHGQTHILIKGKYKVRVKPFFSAGKSGELFAVWNSADRLELAVREGSAERLFGLQVSDSVTVKFSLR
ncbi:MAG: SAM-dependent chlorinase/fluorinase [Candidatus Omnitrophica bacterium]|nr:SAM-dependent chlorinase/fluorinase [Candidatus Omnitrophota bacterium]